MIDKLKRAGLFESSRLLLLIGLLSLQLACASSSTPKLTLAEHPLVGKIWDVQAQAFIDQAALLRKILDTNYLLLGERHDNPVHHQNQAWVIRQLHQAGAKASVAFEMIDDQQGNLLAKHPITSTEQMITVLEQFRNYWDYEHRYKDLFADVIAAGYPIMPANLNRQRLKQITEHGEDKLPPAYKRMLVQAPLADKQMQSLQQEIKQSHCNMLSDEASKKMILAQRVRDAVIAHSLTRNSAPVKVLIAGAGHARKDRGVPLYLSKQAKGARIVSIGFTEVSAGETDVSHYAERWSTSDLPFDIIWFTPTVERSDLCAAFKKHHSSQTGKSSSSIQD